jgi:hypothetical protein
MITFSYTAIALQKKWLNKSDFKVINRFFIVVDKLFRPDEM